VSTDVETLSVRATFISPEHVAGLKEKRKAKQWIKTKENLN
jgi:hypothetical protein